MTPIEVLQWLGVALVGGIVVMLLVWLGCVVWSTIVNARRVMNRHD